MTDPLSPDVVVSSLYAAYPMFEARLGPAWPEFRQRLDPLLNALAVSAESDVPSVLQTIVLIGIAFSVADIFDHVLGAGGAAGQRIANIAAPAQHTRLAARHAFADVELDINQPAPRYLNVHVARTANGVATPRTATLEQSTDYVLRLDIGERSDASVVDNSEHEPFPVDQLPPKDEGHWLEVVVASQSVTLKEQRFPLFLPETGGSWVCACTPGGPHTCQPEDRQQWLVVPMRTPDRSTRVALRICVYFDRNVVQSLVLNATVGSVAGDAKGYSAHIDYSLAGRFSSLSDMPARDLNVFLNESDEGTHTLVFNGKDSDPVVLFITEGQMGAAIGAARAKLYALHVEEYGGHFGAEVQRKNRYDANNAKSKPDFQTDLLDLAKLGWQLWMAVWGDRIGEWTQRRDALMAPSRTIQISRKGGSKYIFPWSLVYDIPLEDGKPKAAQLCRLLSDTAWAEFIASESLPPECPYASTHGMNVLCPFGFWGFRYQIEQPPSLSLKSKLLMEIPRVLPPIKTLLGYSLDLEQDLWERHLKELQELPAGFDCQICDSRDKIQAGLAMPDRQLVYIYCHGWRDAADGGVTRPSLGVGHDERITAGDLGAWGSTWPSTHWSTVPPLVFINGCHTAELTPDALVSFVDIFSGLRAAGVIGTEVTLHQQIANEAAEHFLASFLAGKPVGEALRIMRAQFLKKGNLMGLAYTPYCSASLKLAVAN
jgi:hypothetical protein